MQHGLFQTILLIIFVLIPVSILIGCLIFLDWVFGHKSVSVRS